MIQSKVKTVLDASPSLSVILCVGETLQDRESDRTEQVLEQQLGEALKPFFPLTGQTTSMLHERLVIAYEPVWAIGTGRVASPVQVQATHSFIRSWIGRSLGVGEAERMRIIYGGSVTAGNCGELAGLEDVDGFLVGGASLKPEFRDILLCRFR